MVSQTAQLERETEEARGRVEQTLEELRFRVSPGELLGQATNYLRNSNGRAFVSNLRQQVVANPLPVTLVGAGIALLALSSRTRRGANEAGSQHRGWSSGEPSGTKRSGEASENSGGTMSKAGEWIDETGSAAAGTATNIRDTASEYKDRAAGLYRDTAQGVRRAANSAMEYGHTLRDAVGADGALLDLCRRQPVLVAGIGLAIGAALGSLLPTTRTEQRAMGKASRDMKKQFEDIADDALHPSRASGSQPQAGKGGAADESGQWVDPDVSTNQSRSQADGVPRSPNGEGIV